MVTFVFSFLGGLTGLVIGGHLVVRGASSLGVRFGLTPAVVGLTIVSAGTSAPELAVVFQAVAADDTQLAVGSIIGSNIANVLLVLGLVATFGAITVASRVVRIDVPVMVGASLAFWVLAFDGKLGRLDGMIMAAGLAVFMIWLARNGRAEDVDQGDANVRPTETKLLVDLGSLLTGIAALAVAARYVVRGAEGIAFELGVPELIVGLTIVALGTSAPEIITTLIAALSGNRELAVGNAVGSNIFNILLVLGLAGLLAPQGIDISPEALRLDIPILVAAAFACLPFVMWDHTLDRWEGVVFVGYYVAYLAFLVLDEAGHGAANALVVAVAGFVIPLTVLTLGVGTFRQYRHHKQSRTN